MKSLHAISICLLFAVVAIICEPARGETATVPRTILGLYDSVEEERRWSNIHLRAEMPLNHLGLIVRYLDINQPLPNVSELPDVRGALLWANSSSMKDPRRFLDWAEALLDSGRYLVLMGTLPFMTDATGKETSHVAINRLLGKLGIRNEWAWTSLTYNVRIVHKNPEMVEFEVPLDGVLPPYDQVLLVDPRGESHLTLRATELKTTDSAVVVMTPLGGYIADQYAIKETSSSIRWIVNPFEFFRRAFATDSLPKPDVTTLTGRRIFYSHIDGDGWLNLSEVPEYRKHPTLSPEVVLKEIIEPFPDLPVTVAPIAAELDPRWHGTKKATDLARRILALPQVEAGTHTYSHPFSWEFFREDSHEKERPYLPLYSKPWESRVSSWVTRFWAKDHSEGTKLSNYEKPRAYAVQRYDLDLEVQGSIDFIEHLLPPGKRVRVLQWSGDTLPYEDAIRATRLAGIPNINGGDSRFDREYPSYAWVAPIGREIGRERQIYASNSNENTYTDLWTDHYFGFMHLVRTFENTESPLRLKPLNIYYHMYSGQKLSSLNAVMANLHYVRKQHVAPIFTSEYAAIAGGFYTTKITQHGPQEWAFTNRGALNTIRFDRATFRAVDFAQSVGVIGQRHLRGSLYVSLDPTHRSPVIRLHDITESDGSPIADRPYLIESRWQISGLRIHPSSFSFHAQGWGRGTMTWWVPSPGRFSVTATDQDGKELSFHTQTTSTTILHLNLDPNAQEPITISVVRK